MLSIDKALKQAGFLAGSINGGKSFGGFLKRMILGFIIVVVSVPGCEEGMSQVPGHLLQRGGRKTIGEIIRRRMMRQAEYFLREV